MEFFFTHIFLVYMKICTSFTKEFQRFVEYAEELGEI